MDVEVVPQILIVDDLEESLLSMNQVLESLDVEIFTAKSGDEALALSLNHDFALVLLDVQMPGMDGFEIATALRQRDETQFVPIIFMTSITTDDALVAKGYDVGAIDYLFRPINMDILRHKVRAFIELDRKNRALSVVDALHRTKADLERSNAELSEFAYVASHDLQAPLRQVTAMIGLLKRKIASDQDPGVEELLDKIVDGAERMRAFIRDLLAYSRVGRTDTDIEEVELGAILGSVLESLTAELDTVGGRFDVDVRSMPTMLGNPFAFTQLFQNLLGNAVKFHGDTPPVVAIKAEEVPGGWAFEVSDNGIGIEAEYFDRIFGVFQRLHGRDDYPGTGIGLSTCKKIAELYGGGISLRSTPGEGTTFRVILRGLTGPDGNVPTPTSSRGVTARNSE
jgi:two-component system sensor histidine kinase/response regulator